MEYDCNPGTPFDGFRQEWDDRTQTRIGLTWNYCAPDQRMTGWAQNRNGGRVSSVWMERALEGPNPDHLDRPVRQEGQNQPQ